MSRGAEYDANNFDEAVRLLSQACLKKHPDARMSDFLDALCFAIGDSLPPNSSTVLLVIGIVDQAQWPADQVGRDLFVGRYVREYAMLSRMGRDRGLAGIDLKEVEALPGLFPPLSTRDREQFYDERLMLSQEAPRRPCIPLLDEARDLESPLFESVRMVLTEANLDKSTRYLASVLRFMKDQGENDAMLARRLRLALMTPRKTTRRQGEKRT